MSAAVARVPRQRHGGLRTVPGGRNGSPAAVADPLVLGPVMQARLRNAVRALLDVPGLEGAPDPVRWAVVVLVSRTPADAEDVVLSSRELGRWLGLAVSSVAHRVVPALRRSGVVDVDAEPGEHGQDVGLRFRVRPLVAARGVVGDPLDLSRTELAMLWRLVNVLCAPGWRHRDGSVTPAGLLAGRCGRGAATDRLALLLLVLETNPAGRVRLCPGRVDDRGRPAATLARLLGCTPAGAESVLERLEAAGAVERVRRRTVSQLRGRSALVVPAVAAAHRTASGRCTAARRVPAPAPGFSGPDATADPIQASAAIEKPQLSAVPDAPKAGKSDTGGPAALHTDHSPVVSVVFDAAVGEGCSGVAASGSGDLPGRACAREDQAAGVGPAARPAAGGGAGGPLRGEHPRRSASQSKSAGAPTFVAGHRPVPAWARRPAPLPDGDQLRLVLAPVAGLWARLGSGWERRWVAQAVAAELEVLAGLAGAEQAPGLLADRLADRLAETGGEGRVRNPLGWLLGRGLVQRQACADRRCDDGIRLDNGAACPACTAIVGDRRALRARLATEVDAAMPGADPAARRAALQDRLRHETELAAEDRARHRAQIEVERARRQAARDEARARAAAERAAAQAAEAARQQMPCADCAAPRAGGLCEVCRIRRETRVLVQEAVLLAVAGSADLADPDDVTAVTAKARTDLARAADAARRRLLDAAGPDALADTQLPTVLESAACQAVHEAAQDYRRSALAALAHTPQADAEAQMAHAEELRKRRHRWHPQGVTARAAAHQAADDARARAARHILEERLEQLRDRRTGRPRTATPTPAPAAAAVPDLGTDRSVPSGTPQPEPRRCAGWHGTPCDRPALPTRTVCARHRIQQLATEQQAS
ncbi:hypothetical protein GCM10027168_44360 [Streptomyces capparidis]